MNQTKTIILSICGVAIVFALAWGLMGSPRATTAATIKIGVIAPLTGNIAFMGEGMKHAARLAIAEHKGTKHNYELLVEDDGYDTKRTLSAAQKLIGVDNVRALASLTSPAGNVVSPLAEKHKVIHFGIASDPHVADGRHNFIHLTPPSEEVRVFVQELQKRKLHRVALVYQVNQGITVEVTEFDKQIKGTPIQKVADESYLAGVTDFKTIIAKMAVARPDVYVVLAFSPELEIFTKQLRALHPDTPLTSIESFENTPDFSLFEGHWYVNAADTTKEFSARYEQAYGAHPPFGAANTYDIVSMIIKSAEEVLGDNVPTNDQIVAEMMKIKAYPGAVGALTMDKKGIVRSPAVVREIRNSKPVTIGN